MKNKGNAERYFMVFFFLLEKGEQELVTGVTRGNKG